MSKQNAKLLEDKQQIIEPFEYHLYLKDDPISPIHPLEWQEVIAEVLLTIGEGECDVWRQEGVVVKTSRTFKEVEDALTIMKEKKGDKYKWLDKVQVAKGRGEINKGKVGDSPLNLSAYIIAFAGAAKVAQKVMSDGDDPMSIKEFKFDVNLSTDVTVSSETDVALNIWRISLTEKLKYEEVSKLGLTVSCTIVPSVSVKE